MLWHPGNSDSDVPLTQLMDVPMHLTSIDKLILLDMSNNPVRVIGDHIGKLLRLATFQAQRKSSLLTESAEKL